MCDYDEIFTLTKTKYNYIDSTLLNFFFAVTLRLIKDH